MRKLIVFLASTLCASVAPISASADDTAKLRELLDGAEWGIDQETSELGGWDFGDYTCDAPLLHKLSDDGTLVISYLNDKVYTADILDVLPNDGSELKVIIQYHGEKRLGPDDKPIKWVLNLVEPDYFIWHVRFDSYDSDFGYSRVRRRCDPGRST